MFKPGHKVEVFMCKLSNSTISDLAYFAQNSGYGNAEEIGVRLHEVLAYKADSSFSLKSDPANTIYQGIDIQEQRAHVYSILESVMNGISPSNQITTLVAELMSHAVFPKSNVEMFDDVIGKPVVDLTGSFYGFIVKADDDGFVLLSFIDDLSQWSITKADKSSCRLSGLFPHLSINQILGAINQNPFSHGYIFNQQRIVSELYSAIDRSFKHSLSIHKPEWAKSILIAEKRVDRSVMQTDYHGHEVEERLIIGFSKHTRNLFPEFRKVAATFEKTAFLATSGKNAEHRETYSFGAGVYLSEGHANSGWQIRKESLDSSYISPASFALFINTML